jgi:hypothetical protein
MEALYHRSGTSTENEKTKCQKFLSFKKNEKSGASTFPSRFIFQ